MIVEYWYNEAIEKYQFKFWCKEENAYIGITHKTPESGLEALQQRYPDLDLHLEKMKVA